MASLFISYRREDSAAYAGRLHDRLVARFGQERVFMDVDAIGPGQDFEAVIRARMETAQVALVLIGRRWLDARDAAGQRRLDDAGDFVRLEIAAALQRGITTIPVLVGGAAMPSPDELPDGLRALATRHAIELSDTRFHRDVDALIEAVARQVDGAGATQGLARWLRLRRVQFGASLAALLLVLGGVSLQRRGEPEAPARRIGGPPLRSAADAASAPAEVMWRWRANHLLVAVAPGGGPQERARARERAEHFAQVLKREPERFAEIARRFSDDASSAQRGGDLGYFKAGAMAEAFEDAVMRMHPGEIAGPVESPFGFHVIQLTAAQRNSRVVVNGQQVFVDVP